jgi:hypothetical protein
VASWAFCATGWNRRRPHSVRAAFGDEARLFAERNSRSITFSAGSQISLSAGFIDQLRTTQLHDAAFPESGR